MDSFSKAIELQPGRAEFFYNRGLALEKLGQSEKALDDLRKAVELNPKDADTLNNRGMLLWKTGNKEAALEDFERAVNLNSKHILARKNLGEVYLSQGLHEKAREVLEKAYDQNRKDGEVLTALGDACVSGGDLGKALNYYGRALRYASGDEQRSTVIAREAIVWEKRGKLDRATRAYEKAMQSATDPGIRDGLAAKVAELKAAMQQEKEQRRR